MRAALTDIAILTTSFFADVDLVASDILAGLLLVVHACHRQSSPTTYLPEIEVIFWIIRAFGSTGIILLRICKISLLQKSYCILYQFIINTQLLRYIPTIFCISCGYKH